MLLLQGVFRSGTTALFRTLRRDEQLRCFYEPLHPSLLEHACEASASDPDHPKSPLYAEYVPLLDPLRAQFGPDLPEWPHRLGNNDEAPALAAYMRMLGEGGGALLQFNRAFWMVPWLARLFPEAPFVQLVRDPRSVVWSQLTTSSGRVRMAWPLLGRLLPFTSGTPERVFSEHAYFGAYQLDEYFAAGQRMLDEGTGDDVLNTALRRLSVVRGAPPYVKALAVWGAQVEACRDHAQAVFGNRALLLRYEDFCASPGKSLQAIYDLQNRCLPGSVREYAQRTLTTDRLRRWTDVPSAEPQFREGIRQAQIADLMCTLGYDPA